MELFERVIKSNLKVPTSKGVLLPQDLYNLSLDVLKATGRSLKGKINNMETEALAELGEEEIPQSLLDSFDLVLHIINTKRAEVKDIAKAREKAVEKQELLAALSNKRVELRGEMSIKELTKAINKL